MSPTGEAEPPAEAEGGRLRLQRLAQRSVTDDDEPCRRMPRRHDGHRLEEPGMVLLRDESSHGHDERPGHRAELGDQRGGRELRLRSGREDDPQPLIGNAATHRLRQVARDGSHHVGPGEDACCQRVPRRRHADERGDDARTGSPPTGACGQRHGRHADVHRVDDVRPAAGEIAPQPQRVRRRPTVRHHRAFARQRFELVIEVASSSPHQHLVPAGTEPASEHHDHPLGTADLHARGEQPDVHRRAAIAWW